MCGCEVVNWKRIASVALFVVLAVAVVAAAPTPYANVVVFSVYAVYAVQIAVGVYRVARNPEARKQLVQYFGHSLGGRMRASALLGPGLIVNLVSIIVAAIIVAAMFPTLDSALANLTNAMQQSSNPLIKAISPAIPYMVGLVILGLLFYIIRMAIDRINPG